MTRSAAFVIGVACAGPYCHGKETEIAVCPSSGGFLRSSSRPIDLLFKDRGRLEHDDPTGRYRHFLTSPGIAAHTLAFPAHDKQAER
jgi:hypothetical protein